MGEEEEEEKKAAEAKEEGGVPADQVEDRNIVLTVFMHCEGCARKVRRCLKGFQGVESVETDCKRHRVVVKGEKADPLKVLGRLQTKTHRRVELMSPPPNPQTTPGLLPILKTEDNKPQLPQHPHIITVVLKVHMHCHACAQEIKRRIHRMKGVQSVEANVKTSEVTVKGAIDPAALVQYVHRRTGKHAAIIVNQDPELITKQAPPENSISELEPAKDDQDKLLEEKKDDAGSEKCKAVDVLEETKVQEKAHVKVEEEETVKVKKNEYNNNNNCYPPQRYIMEMYPYPPPPILAEKIGYPPSPTLPPHMVVDAYPPPVIPHAYPPQMFSDENPNACSLM